MCICKYTHTHVCVCTFEHTLLYLWQCILSFNKASLNITWNRKCNISQALYPPFSESEISTLKKVGKENHSNEEIAAQPSRSGGTSLFPQIYRSSIGPLPHTGEDSTRRRLCAGECPGMLHMVALLREWRGFHMRMPKSRLHPTVVNKIGSYILW